MDKLPMDEGKAVLTKLLKNCYKYSVAINNHMQLHPFPSEALIMALLLEQHKLIDKLKSLMQARQTDNDNEKIVYVGVSLAQLVRRIVMSRST
jgi:hypothetical protein